MLKEYQVTLMCNNGKYKPVSCIIKKDTELIKTIGKDNFIKELRKDGITKICQKRYWTSKDLSRYGYSSVKLREYDKEKIAEAAKAKYEAIKEAKYESGEWQRSKNK